MGSIPYAFSVHHFINSVGADAGFAAIIGLAILVLLYFAQARETKSLREQAYEWAQRVQQLEARVTQLSSTQQPQQPGQVAPAPPPAVMAAAAARPMAVAAAAGRPIGAPVAAGVAASALLDGPAGAPAGVAAPALTAATKLIPTDGPGAAPIRVPEPVAAGAVRASEGPLDLTAVAAPPPATVAGGANGHSVDAEAAAAVPPYAADPTAPSPPRIQTRAGAPTTPGRRPLPPPRTQSAGGPSGTRRFVVALLVVAAIGVVVGGLLLLTSGGTSNKTASTSSSRISNAPVSTRRNHRPSAAPFNPATVTVAVLNGTATNQLAHRVALKLDGVGYKQGAVLTAADQTRTQTVVAYLPGHKRDATEVAAALKLAPASVQPIDSTTQGVVCPTGTPCTPTVVVTVGSDLANLQ